MTPEGAQLPLFRGCGGEGHQEAPRRRERRQGVVRRVEYSPFPRAHAGAGTATGFTRDLSETGMCLGADRPVAVGALLRVFVRAVDGRPALDTIARVTRCEPDQRGRLWLGLSFVAPSAAGTFPSRAGLLNVAAAFASLEQAVA